MSLRTFTMKCEMCDKEQDIPARDIEILRDLKNSRANGIDCNFKDWTYCRDCGGYAFRVWSPPNIGFQGTGFTRSTG